MRLLPRGCAAASSLPHRSSDLSPNPCIRPRPCFVRLIQTLAYDPDPAQAVGPSLLIAVGARGRTLSPALEYMRIRALAAPACLVMNVAQGACLGQQDAWTPLQARRTPACVIPWSERLMAGSQALLTLGRQTLDLI